MSLNKILASAQKLGMPVVITDRDGSSPQVVMPFDDFLALANSAAGEGGKRGFASGSMDDLHLDGFSDSVTEEMGFSMGELDNEIQAEMNRAVHQAPSRPAAAPADLFSAADPFAPAPTGAGDMEEKFYLEPLNEEER